MREIKFRAWDTEYKRWENPDGIGISDGVAFSATGDGYVDDVYTHYPEYVLQQYTGFKDKNGVEIYESDRCAISSYLTSEVRYLEFAGAWYVGTRRLTKKLASQIEVIGNKYEN